MKLINFKVDEDLFLKLKKLRKEKSINISNLLRTALETHINTLEERTAV